MFLPHTHTQVIMYGDRSVNHFTIHIHASNHHTMLYVNYILVKLGKVHLRWNIVHISQIWVQVPKFQLPLEARNTQETSTCIKAQFIPMLQSLTLRITPTSKRGTPFSLQKSQKPVLISQQRFFLRPPNARQANMGPFTGTGRQKNGKEAFLSCSHTPANPPCIPCTRKGIIDNRKILYAFICCRLPENSSQ